MTGPLWLAAAAFALWCLTHTIAHWTRFIQSYRQTREIHRMQVAAYEKVMSEDTLPSLHVPEVVSRRSGKERLN